MPVEDNPEEPRLCEATRIQAVMMAQARLCAWQGVGLVDERQIGTYPGAELIDDGLSAARPLMIPE